MKTIAIVLSAGKGKRMNCDIKKQYMLIDEKPVIYYSLKAFQESKVDEIIVVAGYDDKEYIKNEIIKKHNFTKVSVIVEGGRERYHSVMNGLNAAGVCDYVFIHDGARPMVTKEIINNAFEEVKKHDAVVVAVPSKDTIKVVNNAGIVVETPNRKGCYCMQTPQVFAYGPIIDAYEDLIASETTLTNRGVEITDDAMVLETFGTIPVRICQGDYENFKITTPEDLEAATRILLKRKSNDNAQ